MDDSDSDTAQYYDTFINRNNVTGIARTFRVGYAFCCLFQKKGGDLITIFTKGTIYGKR